MKLQESHLERDARDIDLSEILGSQGGGIAPGVVVPEAQTTTIEVIFKHLSFC